MSKKFSITEFANIVGTSPKTIYERIRNNDKLPVKEQLITVKERVNGRETTLITTTSEQIELYKVIYGKLTVNNGECNETLTVNYDTLTDNNSKEQVKINNNNALSNDILEKLLTVNEEFNNRLEQKNNELLTVNRELYELKGRQLLLEDKASRENLYIGENNELKKVIKNKEDVINSKDKIIKWLLTVIMIFAMVLITVITYFVTVNNVSNTDSNITFSEAIKEEIQK